MAPLTSDTLGSWLCSSDRTELEEEQGQLGMPA